MRKKKKRQREISLTRKLEPWELTNEELATELRTYPKYDAPSNHFFTKRGKAEMVKMLEEFRYPNGRPMKKIGFTLEEVYSAFNGETSTEGNSNDEVKHSTS